MNDYISRKSLYQKLKTMADHYEDLIKCPDTVNEHQELKSLLSEVNHIIGLILSEPAIDITVFTNRCSGKTLFAENQACKDLLLRAIADFRLLGEINSMPTPMLHPQYGEHIIDFKSKRWRYEDAVISVLDMSDSTKSKSVQSL